MRVHTYLLILLVIYSDRRYLRLGIFTSLGSGFPWYDCIMCVGSPYAPPPPPLRSLSTYESS